MGVVREHARQITEYRASKQDRFLSARPLSQRFFFVCGAGSGKRPPQPALLV